MARTITLGAYLKKKKLSASDLARRIQGPEAEHPPHGAISRLLKGGSCGLDLALRIFVETEGAVMLDWRLRGLVVKPSGRL